MAMISFLPNLPKISFPLWPSTVDTGKLGISLYGISCLSVICVTSSPNPVPSIIAVLGITGTLLLRYAAVSLIFSIIV